MIKTFRPKMKEKIVPIFSKDYIKEYIEDEDWQGLYDRITGTNHYGYKEDILANSGYAGVAIFWVLLYNLDNDIFNKIEEVPLGAFAYTNIEYISLKEVEKIMPNAFYNSTIAELDLSNSLEYIGARAFVTNQTSTTLRINFGGTMKDFKKVKKDSDWLNDRYSNNSRYAYIKCTDGDLEYGGVR